MAFRLPYLFFKTNIKWEPASITIFPGLCIFDLTLKRSLSAFLSFFTCALIDVTFAVVGP